MNRIIAHIGMPKTGTTAIQNFLFDNNELLKKYGYDYPDLLSEMNDAGYRIACREEGKKKNGVVFSLFRKISETIPISVDNKPAWEKLEEIIKRHLLEHNVIISDEDLWCQGNNFELIKRLNAIAQVQIIVYLRRQDLEIEAVWNQIVKRYGYWKRNFADDKDMWVNNRVLKYQSMLTKFADIVGESNIEVRVYEKSQLFGDNGNVVQDFLWLLGISESSHNWIIEEKENDRLSASLLNIKLSMNEGLSEDDWFSGTIEEYFLEAVKSINFKYGKESYFTLEERYEVLKKFEDENASIAKNYLKRDDGKLFKDEIVNAPIHTDEINIRDVIAIFTNIILQQEKKIYHTEEMLRTRMNYKISLIVSQRKLTVFGSELKCRKFLDLCDYPVSDIVDNNSTNVGKMVCGIEVKHFDEIDYWNDRFVVVASSAYSDIKEQLLAKDMKEKVDFIPVWEIVDIF